MFQFLAFLAGGITLFYSGGSAFDALNANDMYYKFALYVYNQFPLSFIYIALVTGLLFFIIIFGTRQSFVLDDETSSNYDRLHPMVISMIGLLIVLICISGLTTGWRIASLIEHGCPRLNLPMPKCLSTPDILPELIGRPIQLVYHLSYIFLPPLIVGYAVAVAPVLLAGIIAVSTTHPASALVERTSKSKRSDYTVNAELARIIEQRDIEDGELQERIRELSPMTRWFALIRYRKLASEARRMRDLARAQRDAIEQENELMWDVHDLEGKRRKLNERKPR